MNNYEKNSVVLQLREVVLNHLVVTPYGSDDPDYALKQYHAVCDHIKRIDAQYPTVLYAVLNSPSIIIPSVEDVEGVEDDGKNRRMQNVATSASLCMDLLQSENHKNYVSDEIRLVVDLFLRNARVQAQQISKNNSHNASVSKYYIDLESIKREIAETINLRFKEHLENNKDEGAGLDNYFKTQKEAIEKSLKSINEQAKNAQAAATSATETAKSIDEKAKAAEKSAEEAKDTANQMLPNMLAVLGILVGIVVAIVGCYLSILLGEHSNDIKSAIGYSRPFEFARYLMMGHLTAMVVFLLMYLISRISRASLSCSCNQFYPKLSNPNDANVHDCSQCTKRCGIPTRFVRRYPYLFGINLACCIGYVLLAIWQFVNIYFREQIDAWIISMGLGNIFIIAVAVLFVVGICCYAFFSKKHK